MITTSLNNLFNSFRFRLTLWFVLILALILGGFSVFVYFRQVQVLRSEVTIRLAAQASQLTTFLKSDYVQLPDEFEHMPNFSSEIPLIGETEKFALIDADGNVTQKSEHFDTKDLQAIYQIWLSEGKTSNPISYQASLEEHDEDYEHADSSSYYYFIGTPFEISPKNDGALILGTPVDPNNQLPRLGVMLAGVYILIILIAFGGGLFLANQAMSPVQTITRTAQALGEHSLDQRLNLDRKDELGELASTFDQMLDRLQAAFERQRQFTSDASHELRTPLTIIELEANRALERPR
ncbi:MAG: HAMP domain-containing protein, partial [Anaerolineales bacterium]